MDAFFAKTQIFKKRLRIEIISPLDLCWAKVWGNYQYNDKLNLDQHGVRSWISFWCFFLGFFQFAKLMSQHALFFKRVQTHFFLTVFLVDCFSLQEIINWWKFWNSWNSFTSQSRTSVRNSFHFSSWCVSQCPMTSGFQVFLPLFWASG